MSADNCPNIPSSAPLDIRMDKILSLSEQDIITTYLRLLPNIDSIGPDDAVRTDRATVTIKSVVDGRGLACPMPLLKTKVALRNIAVGDSLYVIATDPNSKADITVFCQQTQANSDLGLELTLNQSTNDKTKPSSNKIVAGFDTIYHFIITKTDSN